MIRLFGFQTTFNKWVLFVLSLTCIVYFNTLSNGYNLDDHLVTIAHPKTSKGLSAFAEIWTSSYFEDAAGNHYGYRPTVLSSFALEHVLLGESATVSHVVNLSIYLCLLFLCFKVLRLLLPKQENLIIVSMFIYALMPLHTEAVASIKNRDELLAFTFALSSALQFHRWLKVKKVVNLIGIFCFAILSVTAKKSAVPIVVVFPAVYFIVNHIRIHYHELTGLFLWISPTLFFTLDFNWRLALILSLSLIILLFSINFLVQKKLDWVRRFFSLKYYLIACIALVFLFLFLGTAPEFQVPVPQPDATSELVGEGLKEGRNLTFVENPLIAYYDWEHRVALGVFTIFKYLQLSIIPFGLSFYYGYSVVEPLTFHSFLFWVALISILSLGGLLIWRKTAAKPLWIGVFWFLGFILLFSNIPVLVAGGIGERLALSASLGCALILAHISLILKSGFKWLVVVLILVFGVVAMKRNQLWANEYTLMTHDARESKLSAQGYNLAGIACMKKLTNEADMLTEDDKGLLLNEAKTYFKRSIQIYPYLFNSNFDLGRVYLEQGNYYNAEIAFSRANSIEPSNELAIEERLRAAYLAKRYERVLNYLKPKKVPMISELTLEIAAHTYLLTGNLALCDKFSKKGQKLYPANQNFMLIRQELLKKYGEIE